MEIELSNIEDWCIANKLIKNYDKTIQVIFRAPNKRVDFNEFSLNLNNIPLQIKPDTKFLGITLDASISFSKHIAELCRKLNLCLFMMRAIAPYLNQKALIDILLYMYILLSTFIIWSRVLGAWKQNRFETRFNHTKS